MEWFNFVLYLNEDVIIDFCILVIEIWS